MNDDKNKSLEERARELLKWKITGKGQIPNSLATSEQIAQEVQYLTDRGYVFESGNHPFTLQYRVTRKGEDYTLGKKRKI